MIVILALIRGKRGKEICFLVKNNYPCISVRHKRDIHDAANLLVCRPQLLTHEVLAIRTQSLVVEGHRHRRPISITAGPHSLGTRFLNLAQKRDCCSAENMRLTEDKTALLEGKKLCSWSGKRQN